MFGTAFGLCIESGGEYEHFVECLSEFIVLMECLLDCVLGWMLERLLGCALRYAC